MNQLDSFEDILQEWNRAERESDKRAVWRTLARGGWFRACLNGVRGKDIEGLRGWLDASAPPFQEIIHFNGEEAARLVQSYLRCGVAALQPSSTKEELNAALQPAATSLTPLGFCRDLVNIFLEQPPRPAVQTLSSTVLLVDTARNDGVVATLTLELVSEGNRDLYSIPELAFLRLADFHEAENNARACVIDSQLWRHAHDVRWRLQRLDGKPLANLSGPSLGAAFALGIGKLCVLS